MADVRIQAKLTAFRDPGAWDDERVPITERLDSTRTWWQLVPIGLFPYLQVGQVWRSGEYVGTTGSEYVEFENLEISAETCAVVWDYNCVRVEKGPLRVVSPMVPAEALRLEPPVGQGVRWESGYPGIRGVRVRPKDSAVRLFIPCTELKRFYVSNSNRLAYSAVTGFHLSTYESGGEPGSAPRHLDEVYDPELSRVRADGYPWVRLRMRIENEDAAVAARLRYSSFARRRALTIGASIAKREAAGHAPVLDAEFPFEGKTTLGAHGVWVSSRLAGKEVRHFYVFRLERCTARWPFQYLRFDRDNPGGTGTVEGDWEGEGVHGDRRPVPGRPRPGGGEVVWPEPGPSLLSGLTKTVLPPPRFEPPGGIHLDSPERPRPVGAGTWPVPGPGEPPGGVNPQPGDTHQPQPPGRLSLIRDHPDGDDEPRPQPVRLQVEMRVFREAVEQAAAREGWRLRWRNPQREMEGEAAVDAGADRDAALLPLVDAASRRPAWCYLRRDPTGTIDCRRHALIAEVEADGRFAYAVEVERRPTEEIATLVLADPHGQRVGALLWARLLYRCVENAQQGVGIWGKGWKDLAGPFRRVPHSRRPEESANAHQAYVATFSDLLRRRLLQTFSGPFDGESREESEPRKVPARQR